MTAFKAAIAICGLSQVESATFLGVSLGSVKDWGRGKGAPPLGVWKMLAELYARIEGASDHASSHLDPDLMDRHVMNGVTADDLADPLPGSGDVVAGAMALLCKLSDEPPMS